ncbi:hypothetical protein AAZX31_13G152800 [Glycine max]
MTTTKSESPAHQEKKGEKMKNSAENKKEEEVELKPSKKKEQHYYPVSKPPSAPTLQDSFNISHSHHSFSEGDLQMVAASYSLSSLSDGAIKVVKDEKNDKSLVVAVMDVEEDAEDADGVNKKEGKWYVVLLALRIAAFVLCQIAFSVLAGDRRKKLRRGSSTNNLYLSYYDSSSSSEYSQTHWYDYEAFKYFLSVNIIGFVYSGLQIYDIVKYMITKRHTMDPKLRGYFDFAMDQALAYLLMSASSSAATIVCSWTNSVLAADKHVQMANACVALSFVAFVAVASSSVVSAFIFCRVN